MQVKFGLFRKDMIIVMRVNLKLGGLTKGVLGRASCSEYDFKGG